MPTSAPPFPLMTSALGLGLDAYAAVRAAVAAGIADARASFELVLAAPSPDWGFLVLAGVEPLVDALERLRPRVDELDWLVEVGAIDGPTRRRLVESRFACDVDAVPEGSVVFPGEAVVAVEGPFWQAQLVGGLVQAAVGDATAVATRFARLRLASGGCDVVEDGAATAHRLGGTPLLARAAHVGGAVSTTSALAARRYGIPPVALQPVRFGLAAGDLDRATRAWLAAAQGECVLRVDPARDLPHLAAAVRDRARASASGWDPRQVTLDVPGGDRVGVARAAARAFVAEDLPPPRMLFSGDVDERAAMELRAELALDRVLVARAEGTPTPRGAPHLARYELVAIEHGGAWSPRLRADGDALGSSDPGRKLLVRYVDAEGRPAADVAHATSERILRAQGGRYVDRATGLGGRLAAASSAPLRASVLRAGKRSSPAEPVSVLRARALAAVAALGEAHRRVVAPARYPVGMSPQLAALKEELLASAAD